MLANCVIGVCIAVLCAAPVLGEEGNAANIKLSKYLEQNLPAQPLHEELTGVKVREKIEYYDIQGATPDELRAQMKRNGTTWNDGKVYAALTTWDIRYHYDITSSNGSYHLGSITTDVDIVFHLPRLVPTRTPQQLVVSWDTYLGNLKTHEFGHRDIAVGVGREIYRELSALGSSPSRSSLDDAAQALVKGRFQRLREAQIDYDQQTRHGKRQGAVLSDPMVAGDLAHAI